MFPVRAAGRLGPALRDLRAPLGPRPGQPHPGAGRGGRGQQVEAGRQGALPGVVRVDIVRGDIHVSPAGECPGAGHGHPDGDEQPAQPRHLRRQEVQEGAGRAAAGQVQETQRPLDLWFCISHS